MTFLGSWRPSHFSVILAKIDERTALDVLPAAWDWALALNWARWRLADIPVRPSMPEMAVSKLFLSSTFPRSPTREGSSPFSSPANVYDQLRYRKHRIQLTLPVRQYFSHEV